MHNFSFGDHADRFDEHITRSIPGLALLRRIVVDISRTFVQPQTKVIDIGCSTGAVIRAIRDANEHGPEGARYIGLDVERRFTEHWRQNPAVRFHLEDARTYAGLQNLSLVTSLFTFQFMPEGDRLPLLRRIYEGLIEGGALIIAEKVLAETARFQDLFIGPYYDFKRQEGFRADEILDKQRALRACMRLSTEKELIELLAVAGFDRHEIHRFWQSYLFMAFVAVKRSAPRRNDIVVAPKLVAA
jgi:tRNA (cmo5U34)-methyltransferase